ncbi:MAG TPA: cellulose-binding domain-containing protein, partial [Bacillota bacterium]
AKLPDPFKFMNGTRMTSKDQWPARRAEISALAQTFEFGTKPPKPASVTGSYSGNRITVTCSEGGRSISFAATIQYPSTGRAPYPALIGIGSSSLDNNAILSSGVAIINFPNDEIGQQINSSSRGKGKFYDLYGSSHSAGALMAWAWGVSRLIDALETTPAANIDASRIGVTGCSRNGKGALVAGAFDERIVLTIPQESGSGGAASWRVSDAQKASGQNVQTLSQIITENCWFSTALNQFNNQTNKLPFDHHMIEAMCAPRALLVIENTSMEWLGNLSCYTTAQAAHMVYEALGIPDRMGFSQIGNHNHCVFPASQQAELKAFIQKFLVGEGSSNTNVNRTDGNFSFDKARWIDWTIPNLSSTISGPTVTPSPSVLIPPTITFIPTLSPSPSPSLPGSGGYTISYTQNDWGSGATVSIIIKNNSSAAVNGWNLAFSFSGNQKITNLWNGKYTQSGTAVTVTNESWNSTIPVGGSVNFGFNLSYSGSNPKPTGFTLNGVACQEQ